MELTAEIVVGLQEHFAKNFRSRIVRKGDSEDMKLVGQALEDMGILDADAFLKQYSTTIGRVIYPCFEIGVEPPSFVNQACIISHENMHVAQHAREGVKFALRYLTDSAYRAAYEAEAFTTSMEVRWMLTGKLSDPQKTAELLRAYNVREQDIETCAKRLKIVGRTVELGGISTPAGLAAWSYFREIRLLTC